jgi:hypothetical protein
MSDKLGQKNKSDNTKLNLYILWLAYIIKIKNPDHFKAIREPIFPKSKKITQPGTLFPSSPMARLSGRSSGLSAFPRPSRENAVAA